MQERRKLKTDDWLEKGIHFLKVACVYTDTSVRWVNPLHFVTAIFNASSSLVLVYSLYIYMYEIDKLANAAHHWILMFDVVILVYNYRKNRDIIENLVKEMRTTFPYGDWLSEVEVEKIQMTRTGWNRTAVRSLWGISIYTHINLAVLGMVEKYMGDNEFFRLFPCWVPFSIESMPPYLFFLLWQSICVQTTIFVIFGVLGVQFYVFSFIYSELKVLLVALKQLKNLDKQYIKIAIRQIVIHHQAIIKSFGESHKFLGLVNLLVLTSGVAVMTITGFALISDNTSVKIKFLGIMLTELVYIYISCRLSQDISDASSDVRETCYDTEWMLMDRSSIKSLQLMIERAFRPLSYSSLTGHELSLSMYMNMVKAAYSYFNMMLTQK